MRFVDNYLASRASLLLNLDLGHGADVCQVEAKHEPSISAQSCGWRTCQSVNKLNKANQMAGWLTLPRFPTECFSVVRNCWWCRYCQTKSLSLRVPNLRQKKWKRPQKARWRMPSHSLWRFLTNGDILHRHHLNFQLMKELISLLLLSITSSFSAYPQEVNRQGVGKSPPN